MSRIEDCKAPLIFDRDTASRMGITAALIDTTLNDSFGQRQVSTIYNPLNQYHVIMEASPPNWQSPESLKDVYLIIPPNAGLPNGAQVPLLSFANYGLTNTPLAVNHQGQFAASTISFNLPLGVSLSQATTAIQKTMARHRRSRFHQGKLSGNGPDISAIVTKPAMVNSGGNNCHIHCAGHTLRKLCPSGYDFIHTAVRRRGGITGINDIQYGVHHHGS